jgi:hypothetical protein
VGGIRILEVVDDEGAILLISYMRIEEPGGNGVSGFVELGVPVELRVEFELELAVLLISYIRVEEPAQKE